MNQEALASGRYVLDRVIGAGGMAEVYRARDTRLHRDVAVKMFRRGSAEGLARGSEEAKMLAALQHPGLVGVLDMDAECVAIEPSYLVMEYVKGPDLGTVLRDGALTPERTTTAGRDISRTLDYIHGCGIVHRDIKPSNVLTRSGEPTDGTYSFLLTDFGIARFFGSSRVSATGSLIGTATYFSPEQARGDTVGTPTDIYALGLVLIECLTGEPAFPGTGLESALARLSRPPVIPQSFGDAWHSLLTAMTRDDPTARPAAAEVASCLESMKPLITVPVRPATVPDPTTTTTAAPPDPAPADSLITLPAAPAALGFDGMSAKTRESVQTRENVQTRETAGPESGPGESDRAGTATGGTATGGTGRLDLDAEVPVSAAPAGARGTRGQVRAVLTVAVVLVGVAIAVLMLMFNLNPGPVPTPLPAVPGSTGAMLESLYESVQP